MAEFEAQTRMRPVAVGHSEKCRADGLEEGCGAAGSYTNSVSEIMSWGAALMAVVGWAHNGHLVQLGLGEHHIAAQVGGEHIFCGKQHYCNKKEADLTWKFRKAELTAGRPETRCEYSAKKKNASHWIQELMKTWENRCNSPAKDRPP